MRRPLTFVPPLAAAFLVAGCIPFLTGGPDCTNEHRGVDVRSTLNDGSNLYIWLREERNASSKRTALQLVTLGGQLARSREGLMAVHVHDGTFAGSGRVLLTLDPRVTEAHLPPTVVSTPPLEHVGPVPWNDIFTALVRGEAYVDMHETPEHPGVAQGALIVENPGQTHWVHSYCS